MASTGNQHCADCIDTILFLHYNAVHLMTTKILSQYRLLTSTEEEKYDGAVK